MCKKPFGHAKRDPKRLSSVSDGVLINMQDKVIRNIKAGSIDDVA